MFLVGKWGIISVMLAIREEAGLIFGPHTRQFGKCCCCTFKINHGCAKDSYTSTFVHILKLLSVFTSGPIPGPLDNARFFAHEQAHFFFSLIHYCKTALFTYRSYMYDAILMLCLSIKDMCVVGQCYTSWKLEIVVGFSADLSTAALVLMC